MCTIEKELARATMLASFGSERYQKFVAELNGPCQSKGRLFYWQEQMWNEVQAQLGAGIVDFASVAELFRHCHIHGNELVRQSVPIVYGTMQFTGTYMEAMKSSFPHASEVYYGPCWNEAPSIREIHFCGACRTAKKRWEELSAR